MEIPPDLFYFQFSRLGVLSSDNARSQLSYTPIGEEQFSIFNAIPMAEMFGGGLPYTVRSQLSYTPVGEEQFSIFNASQLAETFGVVYRLVCSPS